MTEASTQTVSDAQAVDLSRKPSPGPALAALDEFEVNVAKCNRERMTLLVRALRSDDYKGRQIVGELAYVNVDQVVCFCASGVAIEVAINNGLSNIRRDQVIGPKSAWYIRTEKWGLPDTPFSGHIPADVLEWYGVQYTWQGQLMVKDGPIDWLNDRGDTFEQIAEAIEKEYLR